MKPQCISIHVLLLKKCKTSNSCSASTFDASALKQPILARNSPRKSSSADYYRQFSGQFSNTIFAICVCSVHIGVSRGTTARRAHYNIWLILSVGIAAATVISKLWIRLLAAQIQLTLTGGIRAIRSTENRAHNTKTHRHTVKELEKPAFASFRFNGTRNDFNLLQANTHTHTQWKWMGSSLTQHTVCHFLEDKCK